MDKVLRNVVNKTIERECEKTETNLNDVLKKSPEIAARYSKNTAEYEKILHKIKEVLPEEYKDLPEKLDSISAALSADQDTIMFKEGLICGIGELNYLSEVQGIQFI